MFHLVIEITPEGSPILKNHTVLLKYNTFHFLLYLNMAGNNKKNEDGRSNRDVTLLALMRVGLQAKKRSWLLGTRNIKGIVF